MEGEKWIIVFLTFAVCLQLGPVAGEATVTATSWSKIPANEIGDPYGICSLTSEPTVTSVVACGCTCAGRQQCSMFCFSDVMSACYVSNDDVTVSSSCQFLPGDYGRCYRQVVAVTADLCPYSDGYTRALGNGNCTKLYNEFVTFSLATETCGRDGGHLYYVKSSEDMQALEDGLSRDEGLPADTKVWVGASDLAKEGTFIWSDGTPLLTTSSLWRGSEPNNNGGIEHCVLYHLAASEWGPGLNDFPCLNVYLFVCQIDD